MPDATVRIGDLECVAEFDYDPECGDGWNEPRVPAEAHVTALYADGVDISEILDVLPSKVIDDINEQCLKSHHSEAECFATDAKIDAIIDARGYA